MLSNSQAREVRLKRRQEHQALRSTVLPKVMYTLGYTKELAKEKGQLTYTYIIKPQPVRIEA